MRRSRPALSVVVANTQPWPALRLCLDALLPQVRGLGAELIVVDSNEHGLPGSGAPVGVTWQRRPGASSYQLRAAGLAAARGAVVAVTEDHCVVQADWCAQVLEAHQRWPRAAVIGGAVENGATSTLIDWASYFVAQSSFLPPLPTGERERVSGQANVSYKARVLPQSFPAIGMVEAHFQRQARAQGEILVTDDHMVVHHTQVLSMRQALAVHFHNGRCQGGFDRAVLPASEIAQRCLAALLAPLWVAKQTARIALRMLLRKRRFRREVLLALPYVALVLGAHVTGDLIGLLFGPGGSPRRMP